MSAPTGHVSVEDFVAWLRARPEGTIIVHGREARTPNEIEHNDAVRQAAAAAIGPSPPRENEQRGDDGEGHHLYEIKRLDEPGHATELHWLLHDSPLKRVAAWWAEHSDRQTASHPIAFGRERPRVRVTNRATKAAAVFDVEGSQPTFTARYSAREAQGERAA